MGGGAGHALQAIVKATPGLPMSRCVVEDLEAVVEEAKAKATDELKEAQFVAMDFHSEQPVKGEPKAATTVKKVAKVAHS